MSVSVKNIFVMRIEHLQRTLIQQHKSFWVYFWAQRNEKCSRIIGQNVKNDLQFGVNT